MLRARGAPVCPLTNTSSPIADLNYETLLRENHIRQPQSFPASLTLPDARANLNVPLNGTERIE